MESSEIIQQLNVIIQERTSLIKETLDIFEKSFRSGKSPAIKVARLISSETLCKTLFIDLPRWSEQMGANYEEVIIDFIKRNPTIIILAYPMASEEVRKYFDKHLPSSEGLENFWQELTDVEKDTIHPDSLEVYLDLLNHKKQIIHLSTINSIYANRVLKSTQGLSYKLDLIAKRSLMERLETKTIIGDLLTEFKLIDRLKTQYSDRGFNLNEEGRQAVRAIALNKQHSIIEDVKDQLLLLNTQSGRFNPSHLLSTDKMSYSAPDNNLQKFLEVLDTDKLAQVLADKMSLDSFIHDFVNVLETQGWSKDNRNVHEQMVYTFTNALAQEIATILELALNQIPTDTGEVPVAVQFHTPPQGLNPFQTVSVDEGGSETDEVDAVSSATTEASPATPVLVPVDAPSFESDESHAREDISADEVSGDTTSFTTTEDFFAETTPAPQAFDNEQFVNLVEQPTFDEFVDNPKQAFEDRLKNFRSYIDLLDKKSFESAMGIYLNFIKQFTESIEKIPELIIGKYFELMVDISDAIFLKAAELGLNPFEFSENARYPDEVKNLWNRINNARNEGEKNNIAELISIMALNFVEVT